MSYFPQLSKYEFKNIYRSLETRKGPIAIRIDINCPTDKTGRIPHRNGEVNLRLETNAYLLRAYSKLGSLIIMAHQGRKTPPGKKQDKDFVNLLDHHLVLSNLSGMRIHYVEYLENETWEDYSTRLANQVKPAKPGEAVLMDNVRIWDFENTFTSDCPYIPFFEDLGLLAYINDGLPLWHRDNASLMFGRHVAPTYIGHVSMKELRTQHRIMHDKGRKVMLIGGKKPKFEAIPRLAERMDILTAGVTGILTAKLSGNEVGAKNEELLSQVFKGMDKEIKLYESLLEDYSVGYPTDFVLSQSHNLSDSNRFNVPLKELNDPRWEQYGIYDIGSDTVKQYTDAINTGGYDWRIRAGPNGVYEEDFDNGVKLIENILGTGFVALGGDTVEELQHYDLCKPIMYSDGTVLLGGGSHVEGFAGMPYPCIDDLLNG